MIHGADGSTVAQVAYDDLQVFHLLAQHLGSSLGNVAVGGTVETVSSYLVLLIVLIGDTVDVCHFRHGLMESGIEYGNVRYARHQLLACTDTDKVCRIVKRCKVVALFDGSHGLVVDQAGRGELLSAVDNTVADSTNLGKALYYALLLIGQSCDNSADSLAVGGHRNLGNFLLTAGRLIGQCAVDADSLAETLGKNCLGIGVDQLILQRRASAVDN